MNKDDLKEKAYDITLGLAKRKYEEELRRNDIINTKAGFFINCNIYFNWNNCHFIVLFCRKCL